MLAGEPVDTGWRAELVLEFERREARTVLAARRHDGPLVVQKPLYPEGDGVCHVIVVHPPAGIAGGDELELAVTLRAGAQALLTTPGAGKWYRSAGPWASQRLHFEISPGACLEWLPQETIIFDGARAALESTVNLQGDAAYLGWEILCLGRTGSGERYTHGNCRLTTHVSRDGKPLWIERGRIDGGAEMLTSPAGLAGEPVSGTLVAALPESDAALLERCRETQPARGEGALTQLPGVLLARYLGASSEAARHWFSQLWTLLRPALAGREASPPRIWRT